MINLDELHKAPSYKEYFVKTTKQIFELIGTIQVGEYKNVVMSVLYMRHLDFIIKMFSSYLKDTGIKIISIQRWNNMIVEYEGHIKKIIFICEKENSEKMIGIEANYVYIS